MNIPAMSGTIRRRILVNYRAAPEVVQAQLPHPFRPKLHQDRAIIGICLIRLENMRPAGLGVGIGVSSENAAHRIAVVWEDEKGETREGVFIPRRDTGSLVNHLAGGRLFPGEHNLATFKVESSGDNIDFYMRSRDGEVEVRVIGRIVTEMPESSCFGSLKEASDFFEGGSLGYSVRMNSDGLDGLVLKPEKWQVEVLNVSSVYSSYYADESRFPKGSVEFDHALLMRDIEHEWHSVEGL